MTILCSIIGKWGRLGNTLFQTAATYSHAKKMQTDFCIPKHWDQSYRIFSKNCIPTLPSLKQYREPTFTYTPIPEEDNLDLVGFFQSEKYFQDCKDEIIAEYAGKPQAYSTRKGCAIHVRRTDYITTYSHIFEVLSIEYYKKAMSLIDASEYHIYSDDIDWCVFNFGLLSKHNFHSPNDHQNPLDVVLEMSQYESIIAANSTFSWWAGLIGEHQRSSKVVVPRKWFKKNANWNSSLPNPVETDLVPERWIQL